MEPNSLTCVAPNITVQNVAKHGRRSCQRSCNALQTRRSFFATQYEQHEDDDVVIPDRIARPLVYSSHVTATTGVLAAIQENPDWVFVGLILTLYATSVWHWHKPRFSSLARRADITVVRMSFLYGFYKALYFASADARNIWLCGMFVVIKAYIANEATFSAQLDDTPEYERLRHLLGLDIAHPNTESRERVYHRNMVVHLICIHLLSNFVTMHLVLYGFSNGDLMVSTDSS